MKTKEIIAMFLNANWFAKAKSYVKDPEKLKTLCDEVMNHLKDKGLKEVKEELILMKNYVVDIAKGNYDNYKFRNLITVVAGLIYVVCPVDLIPDFLPIVGWTDDVTVIAWVFSELSDELQRYKLFLQKQTA